jgi:hypothetical protein
MAVTKNRVYTVLTAATLAMAYFLFSIVSPTKLEFRNRAFPSGFRELVLESASSQIDPLFGLHQHASADPETQATRANEARELAPT